MDEHRCGSCGKLFCRIEDFLDHKKVPCKTLPIVNAESNTPTAQQNIKGGSAAIPELPTLHDLKSYLPNSISVAHVGHDSAFMTRGTESRVNKGPDSDPGAVETLAYKSEVVMKKESGQKSSYSVVQRGQQLSVGDDKMIEALKREELIENFKDYLILNEDPMAYMISQAKKGNCSPLEDALKRFLNSHPVQDIKRVAGIDTDKEFRVNNEMAGEFKKWSDSSIFKCEMCGWKGNRLPFHKHVKDEHGDSGDRTSALKTYRKAYGSGLLVKKEHKCRICHQQVLLDHYTFQNHIKLIHKIKPLEYYKKYVAGIDANDARERASDLINWILERTEGEVNIDLDKLFPTLNKRFQNDEALDKSVEEDDETAMNQPDEGGGNHLSPAHNMTLAEHEHITDLDEGFGEDDGAGISLGEVPLQTIISYQELDEQQLTDEIDPLADTDIPMEDEKTEGMHESDQPVVEADKTVAGFHPTYTTMVIEAITGLEGNQNREVSWQAITSFITSKYQVGNNFKFVNGQIKQAIRNFVAKGILQRNTSNIRKYWKGGRFRVADEISELLDKGVKVSRVAEIVGCSPVTIGLIGKYWKGRKNDTPNNGGAEWSLEDTNTCTSYITMVIEAITALKDKEKGSRGGVSLQAIESYITSNFQVENNSKRVHTQIKHTLRHYVAKGVLKFIKPKRKEAVGYFKVVTKNLKISKVQSKRWRISELLNKGIKMARIAKIEGVSAQTVKAVVKMKKEGKSVEPGITFRDGRSIEEGFPMLNELFQDTSKRDISGNLSAPTQNSIVDCDISISAPYTLEDTLEDKVHTLNNGHAEWSLEGTDTLVEDFDQHTDGTDESHEEVADKKVPEYITKSCSAGGSFKVETKNLKMTKTQTRRIEISELLSKGVKMTKIARILGISTQTVRSVKRLKKVPDPQTRRFQISELLSKGEKMTKIAKIMGISTQTVRSVKRLMKEGKSFTPAITFHNDGSSKEEGPPMQNNFYQDTSKEDMSAKLKLFSLNKAKNLSAPDTLAGIENQWWAAQRSEADDITRAFRSWCDFSIIKCTLCCRECKKELFHQHLRQDHAYKGTNGSGLMVPREHQCLICRGTVLQCLFNLKNHFLPRHNMEALDYYKKYISGVKQESTAGQNNDDSGFTWVSQTLCK